MTFQYESQDGTCVDVLSWPTLSSLLEQLDGHRNSYASLTGSDGGYVQVGGSPAGFTVEWRKILSKKFRHFKACIPQPKSTKPANVQLTIGGAKVTVRPDQVLNLANVQAVFQAFLDGGDLSQLPIRWEDISDMFE